MADKNILEQLLFGIGQGVGNIRQTQIKQGSKYAEKGELARQQIAPIAQQLLESLINLGSQAKEGFKSTSPQGQGGQSAQAQKPPKLEEQLNPLQSNILKTVQKVQKEQIQEAMGSGVPAESILETAGVPLLSSAPSGMGQGGEINQALTEQQSQTQVPERASFGPFKEHPAVFQTRLVNELLKQEIKGEKKLQAGDIQQLGIQHRNKVAQITLQALLDGGKVDENQITAEVFKQDLLGLVDAWQNLSLKGRGVGVAGAVGGALGFERDKRREFQSSAQSLLYSVASFIAGQEGRGLSDRDIQLVEGWAKFTARDTKSDFQGKLKNLVNKANSRLTARGGTPLPSVEEMLGGKTQTQPTQDIQAEIAEIDKRLSELGGQ